jgi:hypothetical protein
MAGRKTKLTKERQDKICELLRAGNYFDAACGAVGITPQTGYNWLKRGNDAKSGIYFDFFEAVKKAEAEAEAATVVIIRKAALDTWQAAAWWLERRFPGKWGKQIRDIKHSGKVEHDIVDTTNDERLARIESILNRARAKRNRDNSE